MILSLAEFCDNTSRGLLTSSFLSKIFLVLKICIPIILIIWGTIDMVKAIMNPDDKKNYQKIVKRFIYAALIFFIPTVASFIFNLIDQKETKCLQCFLDPYQKSCEYIELKHEEYNYEPKPQEETQVP